MTCAILQWVLLYYTVLQWCVLYYNEACYIALYYNDVAYIYTHSTNLCGHFVDFCLRELTDLEFGEFADKSSHRYIQFLSDVVDEDIPPELDQMRTEISSLINSAWQWVEVEVPWLAWANEMYDLGLQTIQNTSHINPSNTMSSNTNSGSTHQLL